MPHQTTSELDAAYEVLGVSSSNTLKEIQRQFWRLMRDTHPDRSEAAVATERSQQYTAAWATVQMLHIEPVEGPSIARTEREVRVGSFYCKLYTIHGELRTTHTLVLPLAYCERNSDSLRDFVMMADDDTELKLYDLSIDVTDGTKVVFTADYRWDLDWKYRAYLRKQQLVKPRAELKTLRERLEQMSHRPPSSHAVFSLLLDSERTLASYADGWSNAVTLLAVRESIVHLTRELDMLERSNPIDLAVEELMSGRSHSHVHEQNLRVVAAINAASVRTGGFIEPFGEADMVRFYESVLSGFENPIAHLFDSVLSLDVEDFAPADLINDPDLDAAPLTVSFSSNKGEVDYTVQYFFDGEQPSALVRLPLKTYRRHEPAYGRPNPFPELPHGIVWHCEIEYDGRVVVRGPVNAELSKRLDKWERGKGRAKHREVEFFGDGHDFGDRGEVPPWYQGKNRPGRRR